LDSTGRGEPITGLASTMPMVIAQTKKALSAVRARDAVLLPRSRAMTIKRAATSLRLTRSTGMA
jgi:hypothetical protein